MSLKKIVCRSFYFILSMKSFLSFSFFSGFSLKQISSKNYFTSSSFLDYRVRQISPSVTEYLFIFSFSSLNLSLWQSIYSILIKSALFQKNSFSFKLLCTCYYQDSWCSLGPSFPFSLKTSEKEFLTYYMQHYNHLLNRQYSFDQCRLIRIMIIQTLKN